MTKTCEKIPQASELFDIRLRKAVKSGDLATIRALLGTKIVDVEDVNGRTALHYAAHYATANSTEAVAALLAAGADAEERDFKDKNPWNYAMEADNVEAADLLEESRGASDFHAAAESGDIETMRELLQVGVDIEVHDKKRLTPLDYAVTATKPESVRFLLSHGAQINTDSVYDASVLHAAAKIGETEILTLLLDFGADVNLQCGDGSTPLICAIHDNRVDAVRLLISRGANVNLGLTGGYSPLHVAALHAGAEIGTILIEAGAWFTDCNAKKLTPLHGAAAYGNIEMLNLLLENFSDVIKPKDEPLEDSDDEDAPPLISTMIGAIEKGGDGEITKIIENPRNKRWTCAVRVRHSAANNDPSMFRPYHDGAILFCVGNAPDEKLFLRLVKTFLHSRGLIGFVILSYCESPVGSLQKELERECRRLGQVEISQEDEAESVVYLCVPAILRY